jgi:uncharacterized protein YbjT (DUF2867 family)
MILITGASGNAGKAVLKEVARSGAKHRAMYRSAEEAAKAPPGTETVVADFAKKDTLAAALRNVESVYLVCAPIPELVELEGNMIDASVAAGVRQIILHSAMGAGDYARSFPGWHRRVEDKLKATGLSFTVLRPNSFHQNALSNFAPTIRAQGAFYGAMGKARVSFVDVRDIAVVAAKALVGVEHAGKTYDLNGPQALTYREVGEKIARHSGRPVKYVDIPAEAQRKAMLEQSMPEWQVDALIDLEEYYVAGKGGNVDSVLHHLLGRPPVTMDQFLAEFAAEFRSQAASA